MGARLTVGEAGGWGWAADGSGSRAAPSSQIDSPHQRSANERFQSMIVSS